MKFPFYQVDVFTDRALTGNPLAVFVEAEGLSDAQMLAVAHEMNLSETTFVLPADQPDCDYCVRIFTPSKEIPFAGHPTIGTAHLLYETGKLAAERTQFQFQLGIGPVCVSRTGNLFAMQQPLPEFDTPRTDRPEVAEALGLAESGLHPDRPIQVVSTGFPALLVPLKDLNAARAIQLNLTRLRQVLGNVDMIYPFCTATQDAEARVHVRGFAPFVGIPEDPATGSVAGAMGAYLAHHGILAGRELSEFYIEQGLEMGRPSRIRVSIAMQNGNIASIQVGGTAKTVVEGSLKL